MDGQDAFAMRQKLESAGMLYGSDDSVIELMGDLRRRKVPFISRSAWITPSYGTQVAILLNRLIARMAGRPVESRTMFANSGLEALYGTIRLARHHAFAAMPGRSKAILIADFADELRHLIDPCAAGPLDALCPDIHFARTPAELDGLARSLRPAMIVVTARAGGAALESDFFAEGGDEDRPLTCVIDDLDDPFGLDLSGLGRLPEIIIFNKDLIGGRIPFGAFVVAPHIHQIWCERISNAIYSSTWAGNSLSLQAAERQLRARLEVSAEDDRLLDLMTNDFDARLEQFRQYGHGPTVDNFKYSGMTNEIVEAEGGFIRMPDGSELIDVSTGLGCNFRGHNRADAAEFVEDHDPAIDYARTLEARLAAQTGFSRLLPGASGASAVDTAIACAMLAAWPRKRIISFLGNYSGKNLTSVNLSRTSSIYVEPYPDALGPYYPYITYIDPFAPDAEEAFRREIALGDVALVWFEMVQGYACQHIPLPLLGAISAAKRDAGYLIGVDEVLTGMWRSSRRFLAHQGLVEGVDVASMSKSTSDMRFPVSWALVTEETYARAAARNPDYMAAVNRHFGNAIGMHVGLDAVDAGFDYFARNDAPAIFAAFVARLNAAVAGCGVFADVKSEGTLVRFMLDPDWFPFASGSAVMYSLEMVVTHLMMRHCGVVVLNMRLFVPNMLDEALLDSLVTSLERGLGGISPQTIYRELLMNYPQLGGIPELNAFVQSRMPSEAPALLVAA